MPSYHPGAGFQKTSPWSPSRPHPRLKGVIRPHAGQDWAAASGTPIPAAADGVIIENRFGTGYGNLVALEHRIKGRLIHTLYAHMVRPSPLKKGTRVKRGETIGHVGNTGGVGTGPHLHFEVRASVVEAGKLQYGFKWTIDPATFDFDGAATRDGAAPDPSATPASSCGNWSFPFKPIAKKTPPDSRDFLGECRGRFGAFSRADDGFYPIGANGLWHGGIHFDAGTGSVLDQIPGVRCIADGEVVAYRVNRRYPTIEYPGGKHAAYSTGFTLVRHRLEQCPSPQVATSPSKSEASASNASANDEALAFYSLYMHTLDWVGYQNSEKISRPDYWGEPRIFSVGLRANDVQDELIKREEFPLDQEDFQINPEIILPEIDFSSSCAGYDGEWECGEESLVQDEGDFP